MLIIEKNTLTHVDSVVDIIKHYKKSHNKVSLPRQIYNKRTNIKSTKKEHNDRLDNEGNSYVDGKIKSKKVMFEKRALSAIQNRSRVYF